LEIINGSIDEIRLYNRTLSDTEVLNLNNSGRTPNSSLPTNGLMLWLPFNENVGSDVHSINLTNTTQSFSSALTDISWKNDGQLINITETGNYTINAVSGLFTVINPLYYYNWIKISWTSSWITDDSVTDMVGNFTSGINNVSKKIPNILLIGAIIAILGILFMLWKFSDKMGLNMGDSL